MLSQGFEGVAKIPELRKRVLFTLAMLIVYRLGIFVPTPGVDSEKLNRMFSETSQTLYGLINMFTGGAFENFSVFALGIAPYISVSIIVQILSHTIPALESLSKEGDRGRRTLTRYTRIGTIALALAHGLAISYGLESQALVLEVGWRFRIVTMITLAAGTAFLMWLGEQITERGIGNGISVLIFAGIVARMPSVLASSVDLMRSGEINPATFLLLLVFGVGVVALIVFVERTHRRIPIQYPKRAMGRGMQSQAVTQHMPLKLNTSGVIPPIFASMFLVFIGMLLKFSSNEWLQQQSSLLTPGTFVYEAIFGGLIIFFCYFYTSLMWDPDKIAENLKKNGGFIPTVRPGKETADFLNRVLSRLTLWGGLYVCIICIAPVIFYDRMGAAIFTQVFGGTAVLISVGVILDTVSQMEAHIRTRNYEGFMSKGPGKTKMFGRGMQARSRLIQR